MKNPRFSTARLIFTAVFCASFLCGATQANAEKGNLRVYGDYMQFALPATGAGIALIKGDTAGLAQLFRTGLLTVGGVTAIKESFNNTSWGERPRGDGDKSFVSGHTAYACAGSAFIGKRYGWEYGLPAFGLAASVGYSRINAEKHHWRDVIGGCALSYAIAQFFVVREGYDNIIPVVGPEFIGFRYATPIRF